MKAHPSSNTRCRSWRWRLAPLPASASTVRIYITNAAGDSIHVIDPVTNKVVQEIKNLRRRPWHRLLAGRLAGLCHQRGDRARSTCSTARPAS